MDDESTDKQCAVCNKETMLALFGVAIGVVFILMGLDTLRRMRLSEREVEGQVSDE